MILISAGKRGAWWKNTLTLLVKKTTSKPLSAMNGDISHCLKSPPDEAEGIFKLAEVDVKKRRDFMQNVGQFM